METTATHTIELTNSEVTTLLMWASASFGEWGYLPECEALVRKLSPLIDENPDALLALHYASRTP